MNWIIWTMVVLIIIETTIILLINEMNTSLREDVMDLSGSVDSAQVKYMDLQFELEEWEKTLNSEYIKLENKLTRIRKCNNQSSQMKMYYKKRYTELNLKINKWLKQENK